ncbi:glycosyltransferase family 2 protein [Echinicola sediminis]
MDDNKPLVSILIPNYNKAPYLRDTLDSVLNQTYQNWECIIVDDRSTDGSWEVLLDYQDKDNRFKIFKRPDHLHKGGNVCRNYAFQLSSGDFIQWLDSDDILDNRKIEAQINDLKQYRGEKVMSISNWEFFTTNINNVNINFERWESYSNDGVSALTHLWMNKQFFPIFVFLIPKKIAGKVNDWNEEILKNQDGEYSTKIILEANKLCYSKDSVGFYRKPNKGHVSAGNSFEVYDSFLESIKKCENYVLKRRDTEEVRKAIASNYEILFIKFYDMFPSLAEKCWGYLLHVKGNQILVNRKKPILLSLSYIFGYKLIFKFRNITKSILG